MAHGTGLYWNRIYKADIRKKDYVVFVRRTYNYYYEQMSDCYEPSCEALDEYDVCVTCWRKDRYGDLVADDISDNIRTGKVDAETAKKIWWALKNRDIPFAEVRRYFIELAGKEITL